MAARFVPVLLVVSMVLKVIRLGIKLYFLHGDTSAAKVRWYDIYSY
jgi:hypothetical protein